MALSIQTIAFLKNYIKQQLENAGLSGDDIHIASGEINNNELILTYNTNKSPIKIDLSTLLNLKNGLGEDSLQQNFDTENWSPTNTHILDAMGDGSITETEDGNIKVGAYGNHSVMTGGKSQSIGGKSFTAGSKNIAFESNSAAFGNETFARGKHSFAQGNKTAALGNASHAEGQETEAHGVQSHAEGIQTVAKGAYSHAEGNGTNALGISSHTEGVGTIAGGDDQHVQGRYNLEDNGDFAHIVGNGWVDKDANGNITEIHPRNAHTLDWDGNAWFAGNVTVGDDNEKLVTESMLNSINSYTKDETDELLEYKLDNSNVVDIPYTLDSSFRGVDCASASSVQDLFSGAVNLLGEVSSMVKDNRDRLDGHDTQIGDIETALNSKADKTTVTTVPNSVTSGGLTFKDFHNRTYHYLADAMSLMNFYFDNDVYEEDYTCELSFNSGETPTTITYTNSGILNWLGTDCSIIDGYSVFKPTANKHYDIIFYFNGTCFVGMVNGFTMIQPGYDNKDYIDPSNNEE